MNIVVGSLCRIKRPESINAGTIIPWGDRDETDVELLRKSYPTWIELVVVLVRVVGKPDAIGDFLVSPRNTSITFRCRETLLCLVSPLELLAEMAE